VIGHTDGCRQQIFKVIWILTHNFKCKNGLCPSS